MSGADIGAAVGGGVGLLVALVLVWAVASLRRAVAGLEKAVHAANATAEEVRTRTVPLLEDLKGLVGRSEQEMERMDGLLETAISVSQTIDSAAKLAYLAFSNPAIKLLAFGAGTSRAAARFRRRGR